MFLTTGISVDMFPHTDGILDMFPHTGGIHKGVSGHVETVCLLYHQKKDFISVPYEPQDADYLEIILDKRNYDCMKNTDIS